MRLKHLLFTFALTTIFLIAGKVGWGQLISQGFETTTLPAGWSGDVYFNSTANHGTLLGANGAGFNASLKYLSTPAVNGAGTLTFWMKGSSATSQISLKVFKNVDGAGWVSVADYPKPNGSTWTEFTVAINEPATSSVELKFEAYDRTGNSLYLDDIILTEYAGPDTDAPVWSDSYPMIDGITKTSAVLKVSTDEPGKAFYQVLADGAAAPAVDDLIAAGTEIAIAAGATPYPENLTGLTLGTAYDVYVVAQDDETTPNKQAAVTKIDLLTLAASNAAEITAFSFAEQTGPATINSAAGTIDIQVAGGTALDNLVATFTLSADATAAVGGVPQVSATTANDFSSDVTYTVTAEDGVTTKDWVVSVSVPSTDATITSTVYSVDGGTFAISNVPFNTPVDAFKSRLTPATAATFEVYESDGTTLATTLATGHKVIVTAEAGNTQDYTIELLAAPTGDLFISEYLEGTSNNKAIEIYNGTGVALDLAPYTVKLGGNGGAWGAPQTLSGILANGEVYVIGNASANAAILAQSDITSSVTFFNGDDALGLFNNDVLIDVFGQQGTDPGTGWSVAGITNATVDHTVIRKSAITLGNTDWATSFGTNETDSEWEVYPTNYIGGLGSHNQPKLSAEANITAFDVPGQVGDEVINTTAYTVTIGVTAATVKTALVPTIAVSAGATIDPASGVEQDFSAGKSYVVTAEGANTQSWNVTVTNYSNDATLSDLKVTGATVTGFASETTEYGVEVPFGSTEVPAVTYTVNQENATAVVTNAAGIPGSTTVEVTSQDLTVSKTYTINFTEAAAKTDATLSALTVNGVDVLAYDGLVVDPSTEPGATMWFNNFTDAMGIVATQNDADATVSIKKNDVEVVDPANEPLADNDVILITVTAQDVAVVKYYKITLQQKPIITATAGENGEIAPAGAVVVDYDATQEFTATAASGYHIAALNVNGTPVAEAANQTEYTYTFNNVVADATIAATFAINTYTITVTAGENGTTTPAANQTVNHGGEVVFTIAANEGYHIKDVLVDGVSVGAVASYTFTNVTANASIETQFEINSYTVTAFAAPTEGGVITGAGSYTHLQQVTLTATPNEGYTFVRWRSGATTLSTSATYVFNATADVEVAAVFTQFTGDLFFSEFIEGSSNNKGFEIFNPTGSAISLANYRIAQAANGGGWLADVFHTFPEGASIAAGDVWVIITDQVSTDLFDKANADEVLAYPSVAHHTGNDARALQKTENGTDWVTIDVFGDPASSANFDVAGVTGAAGEHTLVRKSSVTSGNTDWAASAGTDADNSEWVVYPQNTFDYLGTHNVVLPSNEAEIFTYTFAEQAGAATISSATGLIEIEVISSADLTSLVASFTVSENATVKVADVAQVSGTTPNDFSADVIYTVTAEDGTVKQWTVRVTKSAAQSSEKAILTYSINEVDATIDANAYTVAVTLPYGTDLTALVATFTVSPGASAKVADVAQVSGTTTNDFTAAVVYVVTAEDGSTQNWTVTVSTEAPLTGKDILTYTIAEVDATVNATDHSVTATLPYGTDVTALVATFTLSEEATAKVADVEQVSGTTANDFTNPVVYTVTAQDGTTQDWTVTIALGAASSEAFVTSTVYTVDDTEGTITAVPYGTTLAAFKANITPANYATFEVYQADGTTVATVLETGYKLTVTAQDEVANKTYTITVAEPSSTDLFFSEYIEGSSNNKAIEIYNPTGATVDLSRYSVKLAPNGGAWGATPQALTGTLASGEVFVITNADAGAEIKAQSDLTSTVTYFNGDDALGLFKDDVLIDVIGKQGEDPGTAWSVAGIANATIDHTLVRRGNVVVGTTDWAASAGTNADDSQWIVNAKDDFTTLGTHSTALSADAEITAFSFAEQVAAATIDATSGTITIEVLYGTDLTGLVSTFTVSAGAKAYVNDVLQVSGTTANNFTNDVVYKVVAEDGTIKEWTVTVTMPAQPSTAAEIVSFVLAEQTGAATINSAAGTIAIEVNSTADLTALTPTIQVSAGASISPASGAVQDFTNPVTFTVTAQDNTTTKAWTVTVTKPQVNVVTIAQIQQTTGETGDSPYINQIVQTTGIVTAIYPNSGYFVQNGTGAWNGIYVYTKSATGLPSVGDEVKVTGTVTEYNSLTEIIGTTSLAITTEVLSQGNTLPAPVEVTTAAANAEQYESVLIKVSNAEVMGEPNSFNDYDVNDGSGVLVVDDRLFTLSLTVGARYSISGIIYFSNSAFRLLPRDASDIATGIDDVKWGVNLEVYPNPFTNTINFSNVEDVELITVTNLIGQRVMTVKPESSNSINTDNLIKGIYLVSFQNRDGKVIVKKMIKQ